MSAKDEQQQQRRREIPRRTALFGVNREYTDAVEQGLNRARHNLAAAKATNEQLTNDLASVRAALEHATAWSERLPNAINQLSALAAGELDETDPGGAIATTILTLIGEELLAAVEVQAGEPDSALQRETTFNDNDRPIATTARMGECSVHCTWQPGAEAGKDTADVVEGLCAAVVCSLAAATTARSKRDAVTQLADERSLQRHLALRERQARPATLIHVTVDEASAVAHRELYGRLAWSAALAEAASTLERIATANGSQAYQTAPHDFRLLIDPDRVEEAASQTKDALADQADGLIFHIHTLTEP